MNRKDYPPQWPQIAQRIKSKAKWKCQVCGAPHAPHINTILTVHHKDGNPQNCNDSNLIALCRKCHLREHLKIQSYLHKKELEEAGQQSFVNLKIPT